MRITNKMMNNNMMSNINRNKNAMSSAETQYSTGKKIQKPSEDPIIAVRALKLRTSLSEVTQYLEKNIPDSQSWMEMTQGALITMNDILNKMNTSFNQGSTGSLTAKDRQAVALNLQEMKEQLYQEGNANFAGRYVFSGYKTDQSLTFDEKTSDLSYEINESFAGDDIKTVATVIGGYDLNDIEDPSIEFNQAPRQIESYSLKLSYNRLRDEDLDTLKYVKADGTNAEQGIVKVSVTDENAYRPGDDEINFIPETGELILGKNIYKEMRSAKNIDVTYSKESFEKGELRPEHYFDSKVTNKETGEEIQYTKEKQEIKYEVNFNQKLKINVEGSDVFTHSIGRDIDDVLNKVNKVTEVEDKISQLKKRMESSNMPLGEKERNQKLLEQFETELVLKKDIMVKAFQNGIGSSNTQQDVVNTALADLGSRMVRLQLTESRLLSQKTEFTELMSTNEDIDQVEAFIKFNAAQNIYMSSLSATSKVMQNSLMDFL